MGRRPNQRPALIASMAKNPRNSPLRKRSIVIGGRKTSLALEDAFWNALGEIAGSKHIALYDLVRQIENDRKQEKYPNLTSMIRLFVLDYYRQQAALKREKK